MAEDWSLYHQLTQEAPPSALLRAALESVQEYGVALDFGAGALRDSRLLLSVGFRQVEALDKEPPPKEVLQGLQNDERFAFHHSTFEEYSPPRERFDIVNAHYALPFIAPSFFGRVWASLIDALAPGGVIVGQFFGDRDEWCSSHPSRTFHTESQALALLAELEILEFQEREWDGRLADGTPKRWHVFDIIARKP